MGRTTMKKKSHAGIWSVAFAIVPLGVVLLFLLPILLGDYSGEAGLAALVAIGAILYYGTHVIVITSLSGAVLGILAIYRTRWKQGKVGLALNVVLLVTFGVLLTINYYRAYNNPDRLHFAALRGEKRTIQKLIDKGFDVNHKDHKGWTPLHEAVANGQIEIAEYLLENGADVTAKTFRGETPLHLLSAWGRHRYRSLQQWDGSDMVDILIKNGANINARCRNYAGTTKCNWTPLQIAADKNNTGIMKRLIAHGADINAEAHNGDTALCLSAKRGHIETAILLIQHGAGVNHPSSKGRYPLIAAANKGKRAMVEFLLEAGANPNIVDSYGQTAINSALYCRDDQATIEVIKLLLDAGTDVNKQDKGGRTPLHRAAISHRPEHVLCLLKYGADVNAATMQGQTPLYRAVIDCRLSNPQKKVVEILLKSGARVDIEDGKYQHGTPLDRVRKWKVRDEEGQRYRNEIIQLLQRYQRNNDSKVVQE